MYHVEFVVVLLFGHLSFPATCPHSSYQPEELPHKEGDEASDKPGPLHCSRGVVRSTEVDF